ncbi:MAG TPA: hypothetical protein VLT47_11025 [Anaeromyxobacteraceae bacterium]|nr:hypothetical protein [Anaeromyxobacteraceae bacterium]
MDHLGRDVGARRWYPGGVVAPLAREAVYIALLALAFVGGVVVERWRLAGERARLRAERLRYIEARVRAGRVEAALALVLDRRVRDLERG